MSMARVLGKPNLVEEICSIVHHTAQEGSFRSASAVRPTFASASQSRSSATASQALPTPPSFATSTTSRSVSHSSFVSQREVGSTPPANEDPEDIVAEPVQRLQGPSSPSAVVADPVQGSHSTTASLAPDAAPVCTGPTPGLIASPSSASAILPHVSLPAPSTVASPVATYSPSSVSVAVHSGNSSLAIQSASLVESHADPSEAATTIAPEEGTVGMVEKLESNGDTEAESLVLPCLPPACTSEDNGKPQCDLSDSDHEC